MYIEKLKMRINEQTSKQKIETKTNIKERQRTNNK